MLHHRMPITYTFIWVISTPTVPYNAPLVCYVDILCLKMQLNILNHMQSANHTFILAISTPTVLYNTPLVWYVFTVYSQLASIWPLEKTFSTTRMQLSSF